MTATTPSFLRQLTPRDPYEEHRSVSPLELLTDLCFVVAISQSAALFHHEVSHGSPGHGLLSFVLSFFGIFWAWLNFTWFGSAYDNDDIGYRLITILQILGSLVYAAGIAGMFEGHFGLGVTGYVIMRVALVCQWLRAARSDPERRSHLSALCGRDYVGADPLGRVPAGAARPGGAGLPAPRGLRVDSAYHR